MHILFLVFLSIFTFLSNSISIQGFAPSPAPLSGGSLEDYTDDAYDPPAPPSPAPRVSSKGEGESPAPAPAPAKSGNRDGGPAEIGSPAVAEEALESVRWCIVGGEVDDCEHVVTLLSESSNYKWKCVKRDSTQECMEAINDGEADVINLEAGLAYTAFMNYSMKAIANEVYYNHANIYNAVAIVPRKACEASKGGLKLMDFKGHRSCHGSYSSAVGWNYPLDHIEKLIKAENMNGDAIATSFFSRICAPSELGGIGICTGCSSDNGSCPTSNLYTSDAGAFRCLVEELGDIAFVREDTPFLYSMEGPYNQSWSKKSIRDFMYLCPQGGCREINGYPGGCSFGSVPANMIMASNSLSGNKRLNMLEKLTNVSWIQATYASKIGFSHLWSPSTQEFVEIKMLTRSYLGQSALIADNICNQENPDNTKHSNSGSPQTPSHHHTYLRGLMSILVITINLLM